MVVDGRVSHGETQPMFIDLSVDKPNTRPPNEMLEGLLKGWIEVSTVYQL
jgi:hypothetical protein